MDIQLHPGQHKLKPRKGTIHGEIITVIDDKGQQIAFFRKNGKFIQKTWSLYNFTDCDTELLRIDKKQFSATIISPQTDQEIAYYRHRQLTDESGITLLEAPMTKSYMLAIILSMSLAIGSLFINPLIIPETDSQVNVFFLILWPILAYLPFILVPRTEHKFKVDDETIATILAAPSDSSKHSTINIDRTDAIDPLLLLSVIFLKCNY